MKASDPEKSFFEKLGMAVMALPFVAVLIVLVIAPLMLFRAFVLRYLWVWFVVPAFGAAPLTYATAMGLSLIVGVSRSNNAIKKEYKDGAWVQFRDGLLSEVMAFGLGYMVHRFWI